MMENNDINKNSGAGAPSNGMKWLNWSVFSVGVWTVVSPWILGYWRITPALWNQVVTGVIIILLSLWRIVETDDQTNNS